MKIETTKPKPHPTGDRLVRLADIDDQVRLKAALALMDEATSVDEILRLVELAVDPRDAGGRVAA